MLNDLIDGVLALKQAGRHVAATSPVHQQVDDLRDRLIIWAPRVVERIGELGASPFDGASSVAGHGVPNLFPSDVDDSVMARTLADLLEPVVTHAAEHADRLEADDPPSAMLLRAVADDLHSALTQLRAH